MLFPRKYNLCNVSIACGLVPYIFWHSVRCNAAQLSVPRINLSCPRVGGCGELQRSIIIPSEYHLRLMHLIGVMYWVFLGLKAFRLESYILSNRGLVCYEEYLEFFVECTLHWRVPCIFWHSVRCNAAQLIHLHFIGFMNWVLFCLKAFSPLLGTPPYHPLRSVRLLGQPAFFCESSAALFFRIGDNIITD